VSEVIASHGKYDPVDLAQEIRIVDGAHDKGAADLAESLMPFLDRWVRQAYMDGRADQEKWASKDRADERRRVLDELDRLRDTDKFGLYPGRTIDSFIRRERRGAEQ
jgi:hypothetical protein